MSNDLRLVCALPDGEAVVGMLAHQGTLYVATNVAVYYLDDEAAQLYPVRFVLAPQ